MLILKDTRFGWFFPFNEKFDVNKKKDFIGLGFERKNLMLILEIRDFINLGF